MSWINYNHGQTTTTIIFLTIHVQYNSTLSTSHISTNPKNIKCYCTTHTSLIHKTRLVSDLKQRSLFPLFPSTRYNVLFREAVLSSAGLYKITKIVHALWLAERRVCMRVYKHGSGVRMFCFSRANHASTKLKKFSSSKLDTFTLFTHFLVGWNLENLRKHAVTIFFRSSWHFKWEKPVKGNLFPLFTWTWKATRCQMR